MATIFISYSRKDQITARKLAETFKAQELEVWIDWEGIEPTVDWWREIEKGIEGADNFLFLISPDSVSSNVCKREIEHAVNNGKRLIPVVVRDVRAEDSPTELRSLNWVFLREKDDFETAFARLIKAVKTDYHWVQTHRRLQVRALEWERGGHDNSLLLRGKDLEAAESQLATNSSKEPHPTDLQREYTLRSRQASDRQRRTLLSFAIGAAIVMVFLASYSNRQATIAQAGQLAELSISLREEDYALSSLLAIQAFKTYDTDRTRTVLMDTAYDYPQLQIFLRGHTEAVTSVSFSPDGKTLASASNDSTIILWDVKTTRSIGQPLRGHTQWISEVAFSPDGNLLASSSGDGTIILWDMKTRQPKGSSLIGHTEAVVDITFSPDGSLLASVGSDEKIMFWDTNTGQMTGVPIEAEHTDCIAFSPDGRTLASNGLDNRIYLWDVENRNLLGNPSDDQPGNIQSMVYSPDGKRLALGLVNQRDLVLWKVETDSEDIFSGHTDSIVRTAFSSDGSILVSASEDHTMIVWDTRTEQPIRQPFIGHTDVVTSVAVSSDGKMLASGSADNTVILWNLGAQQSSANVLTGNDHPVFNIDISPDGQTLASATFDDFRNFVILWDLKVGEIVGNPLIGPNRPIHAIAFSPDGKSLAVGGSEGIVIWNVATKKSVLVPSTENIRSLSTLVFSPDGRILASANYENQITFWNTKTLQSIGKPLVVNGKDILISNMAFSPDGKILAASTFMNFQTDTPINAVILWNVRTHRQIGQPLTGHSDDVTSVAFSPDGKILASGSADQTIIFWDVNSHKRIGQVSGGHKLGINTIAFGPDGKTLASGSEDGTVMLWDIYTQQAIGQPLTGHTREINRVIFSPDGKVLASASADGNIVLWDVNIASWINTICQRVGRTFMTTEWEKYFPNDPYPTSEEDMTCPELQPNVEPTSKIGSRPDIRKSKDVDRTSIYIHGNK